MSSLQFVDPLNGVIPSHILGETENVAFFDLVVAVIRDGGGKVWLGVYTSMEPIDHTKLEPSHFQLFELDAVTDSANEEVVWYEVDDSLTVGLAQEIVGFKVVLDATSYKIEDVSVTDSIVYPVFMPGKAVFELEGAPCRVYYVISEEHDTLSAAIVAVGVPVSTAAFFDLIEETDEDASGLVHAFLTLHKTLPVQLTITLHHGYDEAAYITATVGDKEIVVLDELKEDSEG